MHERHEKDLFRLLINFAFPHFYFEKKKEEEGNFEYLWWVVFESFKVANFETKYLREKT
jgi:hypothetical protein